MLILTSTTHKVRLKLAKFITLICTQKTKLNLGFFWRKDFFCDKLTEWFNLIDWRKFGSFLKIEVAKNRTNERLQKVDLSEAKLLGYTYNSNYYENGQNILY